MKKITIILFLLFITGCKSKENIVEEFMNYLEESHNYNCINDVCIYKNEEITENDIVYQNVTITHKVDLNNNIFSMQFWNFAMNYNSGYDYKNLYLTEYDYKNNTISSYHNLNDVKTEYYYSSDKLYVNYNNTEYEYYCSDYNDQIIENECEDLKTKCLNTKAAFSGLIGDYSVEDILN